MSPAPSVDGRYGTSGGTPPSGFRWVRGAQGLVVAAPVGWRISAVAGTAEQRGVDPADPDRWVQFGGYRPAEPTQLGRVRGYASTPRTGYHQIRLARVPFGSSPDAVDWEYTYVSGTGTRHAYGRYWRQGGAEYVVYANAAAGQWTGLARVLRVLLSTAQPH